MNFGDLIRAAEELAKRKAAEVAAGVDRMLGYNPEQLTCGHVLIRTPTGDAVTCQSALVEWVPVAHIRSGEFEAQAVMGGLRCCQRCRDRFTWADVEKTPIWEALAKSFRETAGFLPTKRHVEIEWVEISKFLEENSTL